MKKNMVAVVVVAMVAAFIFGFVGSKITTAEQINAAEEDTIKTAYDAEAEEILNEEVDVRELDNFKAQGRIKDYSMGYEETETSGIYHMYVMIKMLDDSELTVHYLYDVIDEDGFVYFTLNDTRINEDVADALYDQIDF